MADPDSYIGNYEFQVPIFVLSHQPPQVAPEQDQHLTFTFVTDAVHSAVAQANAAAEEKAFDSASLERVRLEKIDTLEMGVRTTLRFRVKH